ncbi:MAG: NAD(P)H-hydrate epimerase [Phycisphaeraceae bacterium]|nr:NAD(P)H-hydrate epimerase [Phycisphaeraceae bacterium]
MRSLTPGEIRRIDELAVSELGLPSIVLMENAAINAAAAALDFLDQLGGWSVRRARVAIFCGPGNNGGDGFALARHLLAWGVEPVVYATLPPEELKGDAAIMAAATVKAGIAVHDVNMARRVLASAGDDGPDWDMAVDALLGTGSRGRPRGKVAEAIELLRQSGGKFGPPIMAVDCPSGFDAGTGQSSEDGIEADLTVSFVARKKGFDVPGAERWTGRIVLADIGVPESVIESWLEQGKLAEADGPEA